MFSYHTEKGCLFECRLEYTIRQHGCIPWNYPIPTGDEFANVSMCKSLNSKGTVAAFEATMNKPEAADGCHCDRDCHHVEYELQARWSFH